MTLDKSSLTPEIPAASDQGDSVSSASQRSSRWKADIVLLLVALIWGVNIPLMKYAIGQMDIYLFNAIRLTYSTVVLGFCCWYLKPQVIDRSPGSPSALKQWITIAVFGLLTGFFYQVLFLVGMDGTSAGNTALIMSSIPMWTALLALLILKEHLSRLAWIGLGIALAGTLVVTLARSPASAKADTVIGNVLIISAAFSWALGSVLSRPILTKTSPVALAFFSVAGTLPLHFFVARHALPEIPEVLSNPRLCGILVYSGIFSTGIAYGMWNYGVKQLGVAHASVYQNVVPLFAIFSGWLLIGEVPFAMQLAGGALIIVGLIVMRKKSRVL